jgi:anti-anti-sigma factor
MPLTVKVIQAQPGSVTLSPVGPIDSITYRLLEAEISGVLTESVRTLVLDLAGVDFIASSGIGTIIKTQATLTKRSADFAMINLQPQVKKAFEIMNLIPTLNVFEDENELDEYLKKVQQRIIDEDEGI